MVYTLQNSYFFRSNRTHTYLWLSVCLLTQVCTRNTNMVIRGQIVVVNPLFFNMWVQRLNMVARLGSQIQNLPDPLQYLGRHFSLSPSPTTRPCSYCWPQIASFQVMYHSVIHHLILSIEFSTSCLNSSCLLSYL